MHVDIKRVTRDIDDFIKKQAQKFNLEHLEGPQGKVVSYLVKQQDIVVYQKNIEEALSIEKSVASRLLKRMEKNGFITFVQDPEDKRLKQVHITESGRDKAKDIENFFKVFHEQLLVNVTKDEMTTVIKVFTQIEKNLKEAQND